MIDADEEATEDRGPAENADLGGRSASVEEVVENVALGRARAGEMGVNGCGRK